MERKKYYVSVQAGTIMENQGDSSYELEIEAPDEKVAYLRDLFAQRTEIEYGSYLRGHIVAMPYHLDEENDLYDDCLHEIYSTIYQCGTEETKRHIESMRIL